MVFQCMSELDTGRSSYIEVEDVSNDVRYFSGEKINTKDAGSHYISDADYGMDNTDENNVKGISLSLI